VFIGSFELEAAEHICEIRREQGVGSASAAIHSLGDLSLDKGDLESAERYYSQALALGPEEGDVRLRAYCLAGLACVAARSATT
jgi:hypothetical protein